MPPLCGRKGISRLRAHSREHPEEPTKEDNQATRQNQKGESEKERRGEKEEMEAKGIKPVFLQKKGKKMKVELHLGRRGGGREEEKCVKERRRGGG